VARLGTTGALALVDRGLVRRGFLSATVVQVLATARRFASKLDRSIVHTTTDDVRRFLAAGASSWSANTQAAYLYRLRLVFRVLIGLGHVLEDPTERLRLPSPARRPQLLLADDHVRRLLVAASTPVGSGPIAEAKALRDRAALELLVGLGLRSAEVRAAKLVDLDLRQGTLLVRRAKRGQPEELPLPRASLEHVAAWVKRGHPLLARGHDQDALVIRDDGKPLHRTAMGKLVDRVKKRADIERAYPHAFRRATSTALVRAGTPLPVVQRLLGHQRLTTTAVYVEVEREDLHRLVALLDAARERERARGQSRNQPEPATAPVRVRRGRGTRAG
jgi:site-specific recombinase XerD